MRTHARARARDKEEEHPKRVLLRTSKPDKTGQTLRVGDTISGLC
nr:MAG TPA: hypothetical protein [Caudoviricetes sp.]